MKILVFCQEHARHSTTDELALYRVVIAELGANVVRD
jgi:hypothetical protein